ncbi:Oocyte maintenance defects, partial [Caligus rogercresseyi]
MEAPMDDEEGESELMMELRCFLEASLSEGGRRRSNRSSASYLLENLPSSRGAVLEYYGGLLLGEEDPGPIKDRSGSLSMGLSLLGEFSSRFRPPPAIKQGDMDEVMRFMMDIQGVRMLMELLSLCFRKIAADKEDFYPASVLLSTRTRHSPHFDWVVAYLGASFPEAITAKVLYAGLQVFHTRMTQEERLCRGHSRPSHRDARGASCQGLLTNVKMTAKGGNSIEIATLPYILQLASISPCISKALTSLSTTLLRTPEVIEKIVKLVPKWNKSYFHSSGSLLDLIVHLIIFRMILEILEISSATNGCKILCETLLSDNLLPQEGIKEDEDRDGSEKEIPCLSSVSEKLHLFLCKEAFLSENAFVQDFTSTLLQLTSLIFPTGRGVAIQVIRYGLSHAAPNQREIGCVLKFIQDTELWHKDIASLAVKQALRASKKASSSTHLFHNLLIILQHETHEKEMLLSKLTPITRSCLGELIDRLEDPQLIPQIIPLLRLSALSPEHIKIVQRLSQCLFTLFSQSPRPIELILSIEGILSCLSSHYPLSLPMILRFLLEGAISSKHAELLEDTIKRKR